MSAASPGVTALFFRNDYYDTDEAYLFALAEGLRTNMRPLPPPASSSRSTARTWPWGGTPSFAI